MNQRLKQTFIHNFYLFTTLQDAMTATKLVPREMRARVKLAKNTVRLH